MTASGSLRPSARVVDRALADRGLRDRVVELPDSTRTAEEAARAVGCSVGQIVKSLVFRGRTSGRPVLVLAAGDHRVNESWMAQYVGEAIGRADPEFVRTETGFAIGGVPPVGHTGSFPTFIDLDLLEHPGVWAAAGHPNAVCRLTPLELLTACDGRVVPVVPAAPTDGGNRSWVTFDCYGTLVDWRLGLLASLRTALGPRGRGEERVLLERYLEEEPQVESGPYRPYREVVEVALLRAAERGGVALERGAIARLVDEIPEWPAFEDAAPVLDSLRARGVGVALLSNIDTGILGRTLARSGLKVDLFVTAEEVRSYKPAPPHWVRFLQRTGARPENVLHCSGAYEYDLPTAARLGFRTAFVSRYPGVEPGPAAGAKLADLQQILAWTEPSRERGTLNPPGES